MNKVLIYVGKEKMDFEKMKQALDSIHLKYSFLSDEDLNRKMDELMKEENKKVCVGKRNGLIYVDSSEIEEIQKLEDVLVKSGVNIVRKASKTETNINWKLEVLLDEVDKEYEYFKLKDTLYSLVVNPNREKLASDTNYLRLMSMGFALLEDDKCEKEVLEIAIKSIESYK